MQNNSSLNCSLIILAYVKSNRGFESIKNFGTICHNVEQKMMIMTIRKEKYLENLNHFLSFWNYFEFTILHFIANVELSKKSVNVIVWTKSQRVIYSQALLVQQRWPNSKNINIPILHKIFPILFMFFSSKIDFLEVYRGLPWNPKSIALISSIFLLSYVTGMPFSRLIALLIFPTLSQHISNFMNRIIFYFSSEVGCYSFNDNKRVVFIYFSHLSAICRLKSCLKYFFCVLFQFGYNRSRILSI